MDPDKVTAAQLSERFEMALQALAAYCSSQTDWNPAFNDLSRLTVLCKGALQYRSDLRRRLCLDDTDDAEVKAYLNGAGLTDRCLTDTVRHMVNLDALSVVSEKITDAGVIAIACHLKRLDYLLLGDLCRGSDGITGVGLSYVCDNLKLLTHLDLTSTGITDSDLHHLTKVPLLRSLDIGNCDNLTEDWPKSFPSLQLRDLSVAYLPLNETFVPLISSIHSLKVLDTPYVDASARMRHYEAVKKCFSDHGFFFHDKECKKLPEEKLVMLRQLPLVGHLFN